ncbi:outer membrane protein assembly factor BamC [Catenovulum sp. 2E275]|uniref:outer membrane protein assembly factor BamC n=1 Tax=Catenovulum sp. 2E275 TaxID=2980497 RepID=UPI0021CE0FD6|nr:outer membrane protein assembly factor BamC [Catenovulum sp. 2E275]MCU4677452.1 outer membrane protein assembly factor BamC [Catenovulum sp. 2E275]
MLKLKHFVKWTSLAVVAGALTACAGKPNKADGSFEYTDAELKQPVRLPAELTRAQVRQDYYVPNANLSNGKVGEAVSIFPPRLIAPIVNASHIDEQDPRSTIWFEQTEQIDDLNQAIWNAINGYLNKQNVTVLNFDKQAQVLLTDWITVSRESGWWLWRESHDVERQKYKFSVTMKPHGRSGSLNVELVERQPINKNDPAYQVYSEQAVETEMVNALVGHFEYRLRLDAESRRTQYVKGFTTGQGKAPNGDDAFILNVPYEHAWIRMIDALDHYGLILTDLNKIQGRIYAAVKSDNTGFWSNLFGSSDDGLGLKKGSYVIEIIKGGDTTAVVFNDITLEPIEPEKLEDLYQKLAERLAQDLE